MYPIITSQSHSRGATMVASGTAGSSGVRSHDVRVLGLEVTSGRLRMQVADMGVVQEARARVDIKMCPVCPVPHAA